MPPSVRGNVPEDLERVVMRCLAKDPADRFADIEGIDRALGECACMGEWGQDRAVRWWRDDGTLTRRDWETGRPDATR